MIWWVVNVDAGLAAESDHGITATTESLEAEAIIKFLAKTAPPLFQPRPVCIPSA